MTTPFKSDYALGLFISNSNGHRFIAHGGGIEGFNTSLDYYPDDKLIVIVLANLNGATDPIASNLAKVALGQPVILPSERKSITVSPTILADYVGTYQMAPELNNVIAIKDGHLTSKLGKQPEVDLFAESETKFFLKPVDAQVEFFRDPTTHAVTRLVIYQNGTTHEGKKQ